MEPLGAKNADKLPRITGSNPSSKNLSEGPDREISVVAVGQSNSCTIYQQYGVQCPPTDRSGQSPLDVGPVQQRFTDCGVHTRGSKCCSRCQVQVHDRQDRLEASSQVVPRDQPEVGIPRSQPVCISPVHPTTSLLQLEARPTGIGNECIHPAVGEVQRLCKPPIVLGGQSPVTSAATTGPNNLGSSCVEGSVLVFSPPKDAVRLPTTSLHTEPVSRDIRCKSNGSPTPAGCLACLWKKIGCGELSEVAKELLLASWRSKTSRACDPHFKKWLGWCTEQGLDPVSGPISDVVNFLADLHTQGYQINSLNAYRSAISTVDNVDVGKHPLVPRVLKGAFHAKPPLLCYTVHYLECSSSASWYFKMATPHCHSSY